MTTDPTDPRLLKGKSGIVEGAGLEESRLNQEFIDWLRKWGSPLLLVLCAAAAAWAGWQWWSRQQGKALNEAYVQLAAAEESKSPDGLLRVAREHTSRGAVAVLATLRAADLYYESALTRLAPGGTPGKAEDALSDEQRSANLEQARGLYAQAATLAGEKREWAVHAVTAKFGVGSVAETLGKADDAQRAYTEAAAIATKADLPALAAIAEKHKADVPTMIALAPLRMTEQVASSRRPQPKAPEAPAPIIAPAGPAGPELPAISPSLPPMGLDAPRAPEPAEKPAENPAAPKP